LLAVFAVQPAHGSGHQPGNQPVAAEYGPRALTERNIAVVTRRQAALTVQLPVGKRHRQHRSAGTERRLQQRRMKMQQAAPVRRRAFREDGDMPAASEQGRDLVIDDAGMPATATAQENGVVLRRQPADQRPVAHFRLGHESRGQRRVDHVDVYPRDVIGDHQRAGRDMRQVGLDLDAEAVEQGNRPARLQAQTRRLGTQGKNREADQYAGNDQQRQAKDPETADRKVGLVQSACPR